MPAPKQSKAGRPILTLPRKKRCGTEKKPREPQRDEYVEPTPEQLRYLDGQAQ